MGQYWNPVNLDKKEFITPHRLGCGLKLGEMTGTHPGVGSPLIILTAAMPHRRGGGDFDYDSNYYGPERDGAVEGHNMNGGPVVEDYNTVAKRTIGRWAGDRIAIVGDYAENSDLPAEFEASQIYNRCVDEDYEEKYPDDYADIPEEKRYTDITGDVIRVVEHECGGFFHGDGWRRWFSFWEMDTAWESLQKELKKDDPNTYVINDYQAAFKITKEQYPVIWKRFEEGLKAHESS